MTPLGRLRLALARARHARELRCVAPARAAKDGGAPSDGNDGFAPWGGEDDSEAAPRERVADGAPEVQDAELAARDKALKCTVQMAADIGGGLGGVEGAAHDAGSRALQTGADEEREALRTVASQAIQQGELARPAVEKVLTQQAPSGVVGAAVQAARSAAGAMHDLGGAAPWTEPRRGRSAGPRR